MTTNSPAGVPSEPALSVSGLTVSERRRRVVVAGHTGDVGLVRAAVDDDDSSVRVVAIGAAARLGLLKVDDLRVSLADVDSVVTRRAIEAAAPYPWTNEERADVDAVMLDALAGPNDAVAEVAAWALGERHQEEGVDAPSPIVSALSNAANDHSEALVRESAAAALGAVGHPDGLAAILKACTDKATVRRRAILALAPFDGPAVTEALQRALSDRDWQVRQAAEDLLADSGETEP